MTGADLFPAQLPDPTLEAAVITRLTWRLVPFLFLLYIVAYLDRINVGFAALQMQQQLHFDDRVYGLGAGMFFAGYFCFQLPSNLILQRVGAQRWISVLMIAWGTISSAMIFVHTSRSFYFVRFLLGLAEAGFFPGVILYLKNWFPESARARTVAWFMTAAPLSGAIGGPVSGALLNRHPTAGFAGWQWLFLMEGIPAVILGVIVLFFLTNTPHEAHWLLPEQKAWLLQMLNGEAAGLHQASVAASSSSAFAAFASAKVWILALVYCGMNTCSYGISLWLPNLIRNLSTVSPFVIGLLSAIPYLAAAVAMVLVGLHSDRSGERRWHAAMPAFVGAVALAVSSHSTSVGPLIAAISVAALAEFSMVGPFWALSTSLLAGSAAATGIALINSIGNLGGFLGPYIIGLVRSRTGEFRGGLLAVAGGLALSGVLVLLVRVNRRRPSPISLADFSRQLSPQKDCDGANKSQS